MTNNIYEMENKILRTLLKNVSSTSLTSYVWKLSHQVVEHMIITSHFINTTWKLQNRVMSLLKVPAPRCGTDVIDAIFMCLKAQGIENNFFQFQFFSSFFDKLFSVLVDNASYNDLFLRICPSNLDTNHYKKYCWLKLKYICFSYPSLQSLKYGISTNPTPMQKTYTKTSTLF